MTKHMHADVAIVGAGPTGAYAALKMAQAGLKILLIDRKFSGETGAQWINDVPEWMIQQAGIDWLSDQEIYSKNAPMIVMTACEQARSCVSSSTCLEIDMRTFGKHFLKELVKIPNARFLSGIDIHKVDLGPDGRPLAILGTQSEGDRSQGIRIQARLFVDASGLKAVLRKQIPLLSSLCPVPDRGDLCSAAQEVYDVNNSEDARAFLQQKKTKPGEMITYLGVAGGFSLLRIHVTDDLRHVSFLTGTISVPDTPSGKQLIYDFVKDHSWVGKRLFGGQRAIPLRRPYATLVAPGIALLGDAACQVFAAHGSGIGIGLLAGHELAQNVIRSQQEELDLGAIDNLWEYSQAFHQRFGFLLHAGDLFRRFSQTLDAREIRILLESGFLSEKLFHDALAQRSPMPSFRELPKQIFAGLKNPLILQKLAPLFARIPIIALTAKQYPKWGEHWLENITAYDKRMAALVQL